ncbi:hypothetical protein PT974_02404 [Cladobotryum mycophilum]|uniref:Alpha-galactosidase A n=1 Tax=Cladobotryum mycophilum TaxID=491253 RepID=A0ABR0SY40_9HYPO
MADHSRNIQVLQASVDPEYESEFRILVDGKSIKYLAIDGGLYEQDDMCFGPSLIALLPPLPLGDWNQGRISRDPTTGRAHFSAASESRLLGKLRTNLYEATCPRFNSPVVVKFARFAWEVPQLEQETVAYSWIEGHNIGPDFLGHLTEQGRIIGFIMSRVADGHHAESHDLSLCHQALSRLHQLGIKHGDINKYNFLIHQRKVTLIDFDNASRTASAQELEGELGDLQDQLMETSGRGGRFIEE